MAEINVFELTTKALREMHESEDGTSTAKTVKESVKKKALSKSKKLFDIPVNKIKLETLQRFHEAEGDEEEEFTAEYTPADDTVLIIDPEMDEVPEDEAAAEEAAEDLVGQHVCKCSICGANYVRDEEELSEDVDTEEEECPICGEIGEQIVVGVITPAEELSTEDEEDVVDIDVDSTEDEVDGEDEEEVDVDFEEEDDDDDFEESVRRSRAKTMRRRVESARKSTPARRPVGRKPMAKKPVQEELSFDEVTMNRMLTTFAKENYNNVKFVKISKGTVRGKKLTLEGVVTTTKGSKRPIKFVCENFVPDKRMTLRFSEVGPFTESIKGQKSTFVVECVKAGKVVKPVALKYNFKAKNAGVRESKNTYSVTGRVLSESVRRPKVAPKTAPKRPRRK